MPNNANFISDSVIGLDKVSVCYQIPSDPINSFKEYAIRLLQGGMQTREHWALSNINVDVQKGEIVGVIGNNGAGKSTLLKVISKILPPTEGQVYIKGGVSPILEIGAGFHLELTGKENIYLCGTLLGHSRREISSRMDEIVDFADIDSFINAPLRTYSKGMTARLGFAVATAWKTDILILDEALSVGDNSFQKKCLARISNFAKEGGHYLVSNT